MLCIDCREEIPDAASKCHACGSYQGKLKNWLQFWGGQSVFWTLTGFLLAEIVSTGLDLKKALTWREEIRIIHLNSEGRSIFFNAGDGPLFLSRITVQTAMIRYTEKDIVRDLNEYKALAIGKMIGAKEFLSHQNPEAQTGSIVKLESDDELTAKFALYQRRLSASCLFVTYYTLDSPLLVALEQAYATKAAVEKREYKLRTIAADASLEYFSGERTKPKEAKFSVRGVLYEKADCIPTP